MLPDAPQTTTSKRRQHMARIGRMRRALSAGLLGGVAAATVCLLSTATPPTLSAATMPGAEAGAMIAGLALAAAWVVTFRLAATALAVVAAALPGLAGRGARRLALAWSPRFCRSIVRAALGCPSPPGRWRRVQRRSPTSRRCPSSTGSRRRPRWSSGSRQPSVPLRNPSPLALRRDPGSRSASSVARSSCVPATRCGASPPGRCRPATATRTSHEPGRAGTPRTATS